jgi:DNA replication protein DnaC
MTDAPKLLLAHHLKTLRLPTFLREYEKLSRQCAAEGLDHVQFLGRLVELKMIDRERRMIERRIKAAKFPTVKSLDSFDFKAIPGLNKIQVLELAWCEWIERTRARHIAGVVERDALDKARQHFLGRGFLVVLHRSCPGCPSV